MQSCLTFCICKEAAHTVLMIAVQVMLIKVVQLLRLICRAIPILSLHSLHIFHRHGFMVLMPFCSATCTTSLSIEYFCLHLQHSKPWQQRSHPQFWCITITATIVIINFLIQINRKQNRNSMMINTINIDRKQNRISTKSCAGLSASKPHHTIYVCVCCCR